MGGGAAAGGAARALLKALTGAEPEAEALAGYPSPGDGSWARRALGVYQDALAARCRPRLHVLERLLACLRLPHQRPHEALLPLQVGLGCPGLARHSKHCQFPSFCLPRGLQRHLPGFFVRPRLHVLERLLACLRLPHQRPHDPLQVQSWVDCERMLKVAPSAAMGACSWDAHGGDMLSWFVAQLRQTACSA